MYLPFDVMKQDVERMMIKRPAMLNYFAAAAISLTAGTPAVALGIVNTSNNVIDRIVQARGIIDSPEPHAPFGVKILRTESIERSVEILASGFALWCVGFGSIIYRQEKLNKGPKI
jgi:hypothetical protein